MFNLQKNKSNVANLPHMIGYRTVFIFTTSTWNVVNAKKKSKDYHSVEEKRHHFTRIPGSV